MRQRRKVNLTIYCMIALLFVLALFGPARTVKAEDAVDANGELVLEEPVKILLVGNSLTRYGDHANGLTVQGHLKEMVETSGRNAVITTVAFAGSSLRNIAGLNPMKEKQAKKFQKQLESEDWDYVIIQELSRFHFKQYEERSIPAVKKIIKMVRKNSPKAKVMMYLPRGFDFERKKRDKLTAMQMECHIGAAGERLEKRFGIELIPAGMHFYRCGIQYPEIVLIGADKKHPSRAGYFLTASCIYQKIFREQPQISGEMLEFAAVSRKEAEQLIGLWGDGIKSRKTEITLQEGDTHVMRVTDAAGNTDLELRFVSVDESVATVDDVTGEITATGSGMTVIMAETIDGWQTYCTVYVPYQAPEGIVAETEFEIDADGQKVNSVTLRWEKQQGARYEVYRSESKKGPFKLLAQVKKRRYVDMTATAGKTWYYKIVAVNDYSECRSKKSEAVKVSFP